LPFNLRSALSAALLAACAQGFAGVSAHAATTPTGELIAVGSSEAGNYLSALIASADRDSGAADLFYREALRADPRNLELLEHAFAAALASGDAQGAMPLAERLVAHDPGNSLARLALASRAIVDGAWPAARAQLSAGDAGRARDVTTSLLIAWTWAGAGDLKRALDVVDHITDPNLRVFRDYHAGLIADALGNPVEARRRLKLAYESDKNTLRLADAYARFLSRHNDIEGAKNVYGEFNKLIPNHPVVTAAMLELNAGRPLAPLVATARDGAAETLYGLGGANSSRQGDELAALIYLRLALLIRPDHDLAAVTVANLLADMKQPEASIKAYESVPKTSPMRESAEIQIAMTIDEQGQSEEAMRRVQAIVDAHPQDPDAWSSLGSLQRAAKKFDEAAKSYDKAIELIGTPDPGNWTLYYFRGISHERSKQWPLAEADFKKALELYPDQPLVLNYLGYTWVDKGVNLDEAFKMLQRAVDLKPTDGYIVDSLGWAHFKLGHYQEATEQLERAIELKPADPVVNDHLGDAYWKVGRKTEAHFQWNHARDMGPDPEDLQGILDKIANGLPDAAPAPATPTAGDSATKPGG
jgi:tetratricopeptide (TPR) repeat protein